MFSRRTKILFAITLFIIAIAFALAALHIISGVWLAVAVLVPIIVTALSSDIDLTPLYKKDRELRHQHWGY